MIFAATNSITCEFIPVGTCSDGVEVFYVNNDSVSTDAPAGEVLSATASMVAAPYNDVLCCKSPFGNLSSVFVHKDDVCPNGGEEFMYYTNITNARIGLKDIETSSPYSFNKSYYTDKMCLSVPDAFESVDIVVSDKDLYEDIGYSCMYKISSVENGQISSCDAKFNGGNQYDYTVWTRMWESKASLSCSSDCTSKLDGRVYVACSSQISVCKNVPSQCNGAILGSWVSINSFQEVQCSAPWNVIRSDIITNESLVVKTVDEDKCSNLINKKYSVIVDNELVTMRVYMCAGE